MAGISTSLFISEIRDELFDNGATQTFDTATLTRMLTAEFRKLWSYGIFKNVTNWAGTKTDMPLATTLDTDYATPAGWIRVSDIEFWSDTTTPLYIARSALWDDRVRAGYVTIYDAPDYYNYRIKLLGETTWTDWTAADLPNEVLEVLHLGVMLRCIKALTNKRSNSRRFEASVKQSDASMKSLAFWWHRAVLQDYKKAIVEARKMRRPIG